MMSSAQRNIVMITKHTLSNYDRKLQELTDAILEMGERVKDSVYLTQKAISTRDETLFEEVRANDKRVNRLNDQIEEMVTQAIALMNPMAMDLRFITSALKVSLALERAGDLVKNTTKRLVRLKVAVPENVQTVLLELTNIDITMLDGALDAVRNSNAEKAIAVWKSDDEADDLCRKVFDLIRERMIAQPDEAPHLVDVMFAAKNLERFADYTTTLAKTVHYVITGDKPKKDLLNQA
jgi:phosphate transport system protein